MAKRVPNSRRKFPTIASNTGLASVIDPLIEDKISPVRSGARALRSDR